MHVCGLFWLWGLGFDGIVFVDLFHLLCIEFDSIMMFIGMICVGFCGQPCIN